jgi:hypothetical protein
MIWKDQAYRIQEADVVNVYNRNGGCVNHTTRRRVITVPMRLLKRLMYAEGLECTLNESETAQRKTAPQRL